MQRAGGASQGYHHTDKEEAPNAGERRSQGRRGNLSSRRSWHQVDLQIFVDEASRNKWVVAATELLKPVDTTSVICYEREYRWNVSATNEEASSKGHGIFGGFLQNGE